VQARKMRKAQATGDKQRKGHAIDASGLDFASDHELRVVLSLNDTFP
jgi:hypothetical protein